MVSSEPPKDSWGLVRLESLKSRQNSRHFSVVDDELSDCNSWRNWANEEDAFSYDPTESRDSEWDGMGDNKDNGVSL